MLLKKSRKNEKDGEKLKNQVKNRKILDAFVLQ